MTRVARTRRSRLQTADGPRGATAVTDSVADSEEEPEEVEDEPEEEEKDDDTDSDYVPGDE